MRFKIIVRYMTPEGNIVTEEFDNIDIANARYVRLVEIGNLLFADLEIHTVQTLKSEVTGK